MRHRQAAPGSGRRQRARQRDAHVSGAVEAHPHSDAQTGPQKGRRSRSVEPPSPAPDGARCPLRTLRKDLPALGESRNFGTSLLHRGVQQHRRIQAGIRLHLRLLPEKGRRLPNRRERSPGAVPQLQPRGQPPWPPPHAPDRQRAARVRRCARLELSQDGRNRDRAISARDRRADRGPQPGREHQRRRAAPRGHEHRREAGTARRLDTLRRLGVHAKRRLGCQHRDARARRTGIRHPVAL